MTAEHKPEERRLVIGPQTKDVRVGDEIVVAEPSIRKITIKEIQENGNLVVEIHNLIEDSKTVAPMVLGTPVIVRGGI